ncbi:hypothetical protein [Streptomyces sp. NPDC002692]
MHDLADDPAAYDSVLVSVTEEALARLIPDGSLEHPTAVLDVGDTSLGVTSLPALAWHRTGDARLPEAAHRGLAFHRCTSSPSGTAPRVSSPRCWSGCPRG